MIDNGDRDIGEAVDDDGDDVENINDGDGDDGWCSNISFFFILRRKTRTVEQRRST